MRHLDYAGDLPIPFRYCLGEAGDLSLSFIYGLFIAGNLTIAFCNAVYGRILLYGKPINKL